MSQYVSSIGSTNSLAKMLAQPLGMEYNMAPSYNAFKGTALDNFANGNSYTATPAANTFDFSGVNNFIKDTDTMPDVTEASSIFDDPSKLQGISSMVSAGAGLANTLAMLPMLREQRRSLAQNRQFAAEDQLARRTGRSSFNSLNA
jgi:hypothetical protein